MFHHNPQNARGTLWEKLDADAFVNVIPNALQQDAWNTIVNMTVKVLSGERTYGKGESFMWKQDFIEQRWYLQCRVCKTCAQKHGLSNIKDNKMT